MKIVGIYEEDEVIEYLNKRKLVKQYKKAKKYILEGKKKQTNLQQRQPRGSGIYYFRINKQFRAIGYMKSDNLVIVKIDNHQN